MKFLLSAKLNYYFNRHPFVMQAIVHRSNLNAWPNVITGRGFVQGKSVVLFSLNENKYYKFLLGCGAEQDVFDCVTNDRKYTIQFVNPYEGHDGEWLSLSMKTLPSLSALIGEVAKCHNRRCSH